MLGAALMVLAAMAAPTGWDGVNPFHCELQKAGFEAVGPDPAADPYCVEFDKRRQNVTELGVVEFLSKEPARVAAAVDKCFYFQSDHWRGSIVQEDGATKTYEWDGHYFFDKATGDGGAWVTNFNFNGHTYDPSQIPGMPQEYARHMGPGTGGVITRNAIEADPACTARARSEPERIYASAQRGAVSQGCVDPRGPVNARRLGPVEIGERDADVRARLGAPNEVRRGFLRWCAAGGGAYLVGQRGDRSGEFGSDPDARTIMVWTSSPSVRVRGVRPTSRARRFRTAFARRVRFARVGRTTVHRSRPGSRLLIGVRAGRVRWFAAHGLRGRQAVRAMVRRAG